ncbi:translation initiation factor E4, putative [Babesia caballi]|uniref:Translation initiation factor E4, putative n=1 Tax=Babesia caballi TaxID=5871 RepID=A0AAV4LUG3_BABCB|nr:translation initiation factor E4, putative [Babesia caballi]
MSEYPHSVNGEPKMSESTQPILTFKKQSEDYGRLSQLFENATVDLPTSMPLKNKWVVWEQIVKTHDQRHNSDYKGHTRQLVSFDSVQSFWNLWFNIPQPSELSTTHRLTRECTDGTEHIVDAIMVFRDGIEPMWEDPMNKDGGHFDYRFKFSEVSQMLVDEYWNNIVLGLIGSSMPQADLINGVRLVDKLATKFPVVRIEVWFQNLGDTNDAMQLMKSVGACMARRLATRLAAGRHRLRRPTAVGFEATGGVNCAGRYSWNGAESCLAASWSKRDAHSRSIRKADFTGDGRAILSVAADKRVTLTDVEGQAVKWQGRGHSAPINTFCFVDKHTVVTGDDDGEMRVLPTSWAPYLSPGLLSGKNGQELLAICDDQLGCFDLRNAKVSLQGMSDHVEHELQCFTYVRGMSKVVCGSNTGHLCLFTYGRWGDLDDRIPIHTNSVESVVPFHEDAVVVGGDDGKVHVVSVFPNEVRGSLGTISNVGIPTSNTDSLCINGSSNLLGFVADFQRICVVPTDEISGLLQGNVADPGFFGELWD